MKTYLSYTFPESPLWSAVPVGNIDCFQWEAAGAVFRPKSSFQLCFVENAGIYVRLWTDEAAPRCVCLTRDDPVYEDSCLEFFFAPAPGKGYFNIEMNPKGVFLAQFGDSREGRVFLKALTDLAPQVTVLPQSDGWGVECFVPCALVETLTGAPFSASAGIYKGNFFKCGDKTPHPHYGSFSPMGTLSAGFHNPEKFATITIRNLNHGITETNH